MSLYFFFSFLCSVDSEYTKLKLGDLSMVATLGVGGFGRVELVSSPMLESVPASLQPVFVKLQGVESSESAGMLLDLVVELICFSFSSSVL